MVEFKWDATLEIGHEVLDSQHHVMVDLINLFQRAATEIQSVELLLPIFNQLECYTLDHFDAEEAIMRQIDFEFYEAHIAEHDQVRQQLSGFHAAAHSEDANPRAVVAFLAKWLVAHTCGSDALIGESIRRKQSGSCWQRESAATTLALGDTDKSHAGAVNRGNRAVAECSA